MSYNYQFRIVTVGDSQVGKTAIIYRLTQDQFRFDNDITIGVDFATKMLKIRNYEIKLHIWDTAGQEQFQSITRSYYRGTSGCLLVYDISNRQSFLNVTKWLQEVRRHNPTTRLLPIMLIGNKIDLEHKRQVSHEEAQELADDEGLFFIETSARTSGSHSDASKSSSSVHSIFQTLSSLILDRTISGDLTADNGVKLGVSLSQSTLTSATGKVCFPPLENHRGLARCCN
jgi:small GTP-binding protein